MDERGRGGHIPEEIEYICCQKLVATILEMAFGDKAFLDELGAEMYSLADRNISQTELKVFFDSDWYEFLMDNVEPGILNLSRARLRGKARAHGKSVTRPEWGVCYG